MFVKYNNDHRLYISTVTTNSLLIDALNEDEDSFKEERCYENIEEVNLAALSLVMTDSNVEIIENWIK